MLDIAETRDTRPECLSSGTAAAGSAGVLVTEPRLLLLDDPFSNLEYKLPGSQMRHDLQSATASGHYHHSGDP